MQNALARVRNPALRQGIIFGVILGIVLLAISFLGFSSLTITFIICLLASFIAGMRASQETGRITTGTLSGLWTGLIGTFIPSIIFTILFLINIDAYRNSEQTIANQQHLHITYTNSMLLEGLLFSVLLLLLVGVLFGVCGGVVGGLFGRRRPSNPPVEEYKEAMYETPSTSETVESTLVPESEEPSPETPPEESSSSTQ